MEDNYTKGTDETLNIEPVNNSNNNSNDELVDFFNTPLEESLTNLGVGETSLNHGIEVNQETEILDLNIDNVFKEAEIKIDSLNENLNNDDNETEVYDVLNKPLEFEDNESNEISNNDNEADIYDILNKPLDIEENEKIDNGEEDNPFAFNKEEDANNDSISIASEVINEESISTNVQPNFMNPISNLKPISLENVNNNTAVEDEKIFSKAGNQDFLSNSESTLVPPNLNVNIDNNADELKDKKDKKLLLGIIIAVVLVLIALGGWLIMYNRPQKIFKKAIENGFDYLIENVKKNNKYNVISGNSSISYELSSDDNTVKSLIESFNGITIDYNYAFDYKNKLMNIEVNSNYNSEKLINMSAYFENGKSYILLKDIYEKYIVSDIDNYQEIFNFNENNKDIEVILNSLKKALNKSIKNEDFIKTNETIKVNDEDVKVKSNSLILTNENFNRIAKSMLTQLKNDKNFINAVNKLSNDDTIDIKADLDSALENLGEVDSNDDSMVKFTIYTKGMLKEFVGFNFEVKDETVSLFSIIKTGENTYSFMSKEDNKVAFSGTIKSDINENSKGGNANVELLLNVPNTIVAKINSKSTVKYNETFNKPNVTNSVNIEQLTPEENNIISTRLLSNPGMSKLITNIQALVTQVIQISITGEENI